MTAQQAHHIVHADHQRYTERQHPKGVGRVVGDHPVINVHRKQRHDQRKQVDQQRRTDHIAIDRALLDQRAPEPMPFGNLADLGRTRIEAETRPGKKSDTKIALGKRFAQQRDFALPGLRKQQARATSGLIPAKQHTGLIALEQQNDRQQGVINRIERAANNLARQTRPCRSTRKQRRGKAAFFQRQTSRQGRSRTGTTVQTGQLDKTGQQGIMMQQILA